MTEARFLERARLQLHKPFVPVMGHMAFLVQCLTNLLENAAKFVPSGTVPEIHVRTEKKETSVRIWIEDNGIGIDPAYHNRLFQMFERVHRDKTYEGTGIGLAIVKKSVERMGGTAGVESVAGQGSRFWIELPGSEISGNGNGNATATNAAPRVSVQAKNGARQAN